MINLTVSKNPADYLKFQETLIKSDIDLFPTVIKLRNAEEIKFKYLAEQDNKWNKDAIDLITWFNNDLPDYFNKVSARLQFEWDDSEYKILLTKYIDVPGVTSPLYPLNLFALEYSKDIEKYDYGFLMAHELVHILYFEFWHYKLNKTHHELEDMYFNSKIVELIPYLVIFESGFDWMKHQYENEHFRTVNTFGRENAEEIIKVYKNCKSLEKFMETKKLMILAKAN